MIVLDTTVLVYAIGDDHALRQPARALVEAVGAGRVRAATTPEVIQEFAHIRSRRLDRHDAVELAGLFAELLAPLVVVTTETLQQGLRLFEQGDESLGAFDAVLAATALGAEAAALVSADRAFATVPGLRFLELGSPELAALVV
ncbi:MAG: type II toxin-antitoxin system VapC family toxin [Gaiella sp.]